MNEALTIQEATFSPKIKTYILLSVGFFLLITIIGIPFLLIWLLGFGQYVSKRYYENLKCKLTTRHLIFSKGAFFMVEKTIPLENIQDLTFLQNPILNLLELRVLKIETAGSSNPHGSDMKLIGIVQAEQFKQQVLEQRELLVRKPADEISVKKDESLEVLLEIRDLLKEIRSTKKKN
ncbi:PH domain-containing protein [Lutimonas sp.]|uniref:PH domain-containing protein n=1 Tax=Lutimonas sp. TaxID=1872403 RepID=UPI003C7389AF